MQGHSRSVGRSPSAFTLVELLVVIGIISLLVAILLPSLGSARDTAKAAICASRQRNLAVGWNMYATENFDIIVPGRFGSDAGSNKYWVGNGWKYRPRWIAAMGSQLGLHPFSHPSEVKADGGDRQDYCNDTYACPSVPKWMDERNYAYGYNHQFLGNARNHPSGGYRNFPVRVGQVRTQSGTVMAADCLGTAAGYAESQRKPYSNDGVDLAARGNHAWCLDPPRLTASSDRGTGDAGSPRTAVDPRHRGKVTVSFCDSHVETRSPQELGYEMNADGQFTDAGHNRLFSSDGSDADPPAVW
ncbi:MAG: type II secretion system protein [Planctomycetota bacterium]|nr:type II secretion system protein [Planctomycetota bacterium]